jgi:endonuclease YncB( thermonuclease family)
MNLEEITDAPFFSFNEKEFEAKVVDVYDGDTIKVVFPFKDTLYKWNCRLNGVDTPELRTKCKIEKEHGYKARDSLREKILNKIIKIRCGNFDKYGRLLIDIYCQGETESVNTWLITNNFAFSYDGGTKKKWEDFLATTH